MKKMLAKKNRKILKLSPPVTGFTGPFDNWSVQSISNQGLGLTNIHTGHVLNLGYDHIREWRSSPIGDGFLCLRSRVRVDGLRVIVEPIL